MLKLSRQELEIACEDFSNIIGSSPDSKMYKGIMKDGPEVAVVSLCISESHWTTYLEHYFKTKVTYSLASFSLQTLFGLKVEKNFMPLRWQIQQG